MPSISIEPCSPSFNMEKRLTGGPKQFQNKASRAINMDTTGLDALHISDQSSSSSYSPSVEQNKFPLVSKKQKQKNKIDLSARKVNSLLLSKNKSSLKKSPDTIKKRDYTGRAGKIALRLDSLNLKKVNTKDIKKIAKDKMRQSEDKFYMS